MNYRTRIITSLSQVGQAAWDALREQQSDPTPFLSYAFLDALHETGCASAKSGWQPQYLTLWVNDQLQAAMPLYVKSHSYGEYVFDWAWADAYRQNGLAYYPKLLSAIPFTPVGGNRLLAADANSRRALIDALRDLQAQSGLSSTHILYPTEAEALALQNSGFMLRSGVQFHWENEGYGHFDDFLSALDRKKSKNIRAERRKVAQAGVNFRHVPGAEASAADWQFFVRCYASTYAAHYSSPYLNLAFFQRIGATMPHNIRLIIAERHGKPIATSLVFHDHQTLYGRYWGAVESLPYLHFETAYYQPLEFCIQRKIQFFEGGAQGEHKMARGFLPKKTWSAHWLAHPEFSSAVEHYLQREAGGIDAYLDELNEHSPFRSVRNG